MDVGLIVGLVGGIASIVGIPTAYLLARRGRQRPDLRFAVDFDVLMSPDVGIPHRALEMASGGRKIPRVSRTYVAIWNHRGDTVRGDDVVQQDPLRVELPEGDTALQAQVIAYSRPQCMIKANLDEADPRVIPVTFDFLDAGDGCVLEIIHEGRSAASVEGTVRGAVLRSRGTMGLKPAQLLLVAEGSAIKRFRAQSRGKRSLIPFLFPLLMLVAISVVGIRDARRGASLVPTDEYDLRTLKGQESFAERVQDVGLQDDSRWFVFAAGMLLFQVLVSFIARTHAPLPTTVVANRSFRRTDPPAA